MSAARERREASEVKKCIEHLNAVNEDIEKGQIDHHTAHDVIRVISQLANTLEFVSRMDQMVRNRSEISS